MTKWWHVILSAGLAIAASVFPAVIASHPALAGVLASIWAILGQILPSPVGATLKSVAKVGP